MCHLPKCNNETSFVNINYGYLKFCCNSHAQLDKTTRNKIEQTNLKNCGMKHHMKTEIGQFKYKQTCIEKYGINNVSYVDQINQKKSQTLKNNSQSKNKVYNNWRRLIKEKWNNKWNVCGVNIYCHNIFIV